MINHVRTLLINRSATDQAGIPGGELIPDTFRPRQQTNTVKTIRNLLFGTTPDAYMLNYRMRQLLPLLHAPGIEEHTLAFDRRVTYLPWTTEDEFNALYTPQATLFSPTITDVALVGELHADTAKGIISHGWRMTVLNPDTVRVTRLTAPAGAREVNYTLTEQRSNPIPLHGSDIALTFVAEIGDTWLLEILAKPADNLYTLVNELHVRLVEPQLLELFGVNPQEPVRTWRNLWLDHPHWPCRLAGLLLAAADNLYKSPPVR